MKAIQHISRTVYPTKQDNLFSYEDIDNLLFFHKFPLKQTYPFKPFIKFKNIPVTYRIYMRKDNEDLESYLNNAIYSVSQYLVKGDINKLNVILVNHLIVELNSLLSKWQEFLLKGLTEYIKTPMSQLHWNSLTKVPSLLGNEILYEQKLWIATCTNNEKNKWYKDMSDIRDSLLPYINYEMWDKVQHRKTAVRNNDDYEKQKLDMVSGNFNAGDIKLPDDLDIIM